MASNICTTAHLNFEIGGTQLVPFLLFQEKDTQTLGTKTKTNFKEVLGSGTIRRWDIQHSNEV